VPSCPVVSAGQSELYQTLSVAISNPRRVPSYESIGNTIVQLLDSQASGVMAWWWRGSAGLLNIGYAEAGPGNGPAVILLHGWPYEWS
jgi:hypothetical protein